MKLPLPDFEPKDLRQAKSYLIRLVRALESELTILRKAAKDRGLTLEEIVAGVLASETVLDTVYKYCEKRRAREAAREAQEVQSDEISE